MPKEAIILAGGLGTRLQGIISDIPKPMAPVKGEPFLTFLLEYLLKYKIEKVILAVGYKYQVIQDYYKSKYKNISIVYAIENEPMGTGGGIANALKFAGSNPVFLLNGDTYFNVNLDALLAHHELYRADLTLSLKMMQNFDRYGTVELEASKIIAFREKMKLDKGYINGGVYVLNTSIFDRPALPKKFSFETSIMEANVNILNMQALISDGYFIDIGIPEDYDKAQRELNQIKPI